MKCPKWQYVVLTTHAGKDYVTETRCKSWECRACKKQKFNETLTRMEYGCSILKSSYLITVTKKMDTDIGTRDARSVGREWAELCKRLKPENPALAWFKIVELTQMKMPHLHLIVGGLREAKVTNCVKKGTRGKAYSWKWLQKDCECIAHEWSRHWFDITGESFIVDVARIYDAGGCAAYLNKYLLKNFSNRKALKALGYYRRFTTSRNWPREPLARFRGSVDHRWSSIRRIGRWDFFGVNQANIAENKEADILRIDRTDVGDAIRARRIRKGKEATLMNLIGGVVNGNSPE